MEILESVQKYLSKEQYDENFFTIYPFTTENINGYMPFFDLKGKSLLTVGSSSDQTINANLVGCNDITVYDICPLTKYFYYLKIASLITLDREEFLNFLCPTKYQNNKEYNPHLLTKKIFNKIKNTLKSLDYESYYIWEYLFGYYNREELKKIFRNDIERFESVVYCNRYLKNEYNYNQAKSKILEASINFKQGSIVNIDFNKKFDNIWLSNVAHYLNNNDITTLIKNIDKALTIDGKALLCYFWNTNMTIKGFQVDEFSNIECKKIKIPGICKNDNKNSILIYEKTKTLTLN